MSHTLMERQPIVIFRCSRLTWTLPHRYVRNFSECLGLPPFRYAIVDGDAFMTRETEMDEPFLVEQPRCLFQ